MEFIIELVFEMLLGVPGAFILKIFIYRDKKIKEILEEHLFLGYVVALFTFMSLGILIHYLIKN